MHHTLLGSTVGAYLHGSSEALVLIHELPFELVPTVNIYHFCQLIKKTSKLITVGIWMFRCSDVPWTLKHVLLQWFARPQAAVELQDSTVLPRGRQESQWLVLWNSGIGRHSPMEKKKHHSSLLCISSSPPKFDEIFEWFLMLNLVSARFPFFHFCWRGCNKSCEAKGAKQCQRNPQTPTVATTSVYMLLFPMIEVKPAW